MYAKLAILLAGLWVGMTFSISANSQYVAPDEAWCVQSVRNAAVCQEVGMQYATGDGVAHDDATATALFLAACEGGDAEGCLSAAIQHFSARGVAQDFELARTLAVAACEGGLARGCSYAGGLSRADPAQATALYLASCEGGYGDGCLRAGRRYVFGLGTAADQMRATSLFVAACEAGNPTGCFEAGYQFATGSGVSEDQLRAEAFFETSCALVAAAQEEEGIRFVTRWSMGEVIPLVRACEDGYDPEYSGCDHDRLFCARPSSQDE